MGSVTPRLSRCRSAVRGETALGLPVIQGTLLMKNAAFDDGKNAFAPTVRYLSTRIK
jgi:hypothetical protein